MKVAIIEDEQIISERLAELLHQVDPTIEVCKILPSVEEGVAYFSDTTDIDLIFSDVRLGDGLSFEIFLRTQIKIPAIFCTAYEEYMLNAFQLNGIDYILKPIEKSQLERAIAKHRDLFAKPSNSIEDALRSILNQSGGAEEKKNYLLKKTDAIIPIPFDEIEAIAIIDKQPHLIQTGKKPQIINENLDDLSKKFDQRFFRINRQVIIHRKSVLKIEYYFGRKLLIHPTFAFEEHLLVSRSRTKDFMTWLETS